jgi:plastocyanin
MNMRRVLLSLAFVLVAAACGEESRDEAVSPETATVVPATAADAIDTPIATTTSAIVAPTRAALPDATTATATSVAPTATAVSPTQTPPAATPPASPAQGGLPPMPLPPPVTISVSADANGFNVSQLMARSGASVTVNFRNNEPGEPHDLSFSIPGLGHGNTCEGPCTDSYTFTAPAAGTYDFFCTVHIDMVGTFVVTS